jgi:hypothetical protein
MIIESIREQFYEDRCISTAFIDGFFECFFLEDADRHLESGGIKVPGKTAIPRGKREIIIDWSNRFRSLALHILDVPQFTGIRIHAGNRPEDTEGCPVPGREINYRTSPPTLIGSIDTLRDLTLKVFCALIRGEKVWIEIK